MKSEDKNNEVKESFCYLMFDGAHYKIGKSVDPEKRLKEIKTGNPKCELIAYGTGKTEKQLHSIFKKYNIGGEWFKLKESQVALICRLLKNKYTRQDIRACDNLRTKQLKKERYNNYSIKFGKYKGKKICKMVNEEEIQYLMWVYEWALKTHPVLAINIETHLNKMGYKRNY